MKKVMLTLHWILFLVLVPNLDKLSAQPSSIQEVYDSFLPYWIDAIEKEKITGISWAIFSADSLLIADAKGYANRDKRIDATPSTLYRIGSITKLFTTTLALQAIEKGNWTLSTTWPTLLPGVTIQSMYGPNEDITLRHLLTHQSGLPSDILKSAFTTYPNQPDILLDQLPKTHTIVPPRYMTVYSNIAFTAVGLALTNLYDLSYELLLQQQIIRPLGLKNTTTNPEDFTTQAYDQNGRPKPEPYIRDIPAGGLYSDVKDIARFAQGWMKNELLSTALTDEAWHQQNEGLLLDLEKEQGIGWQIRTWGTAGKVVWHNGANQYFRSMLAIAPELGIGMVILSNDIRSEHLLPLAFTFLDHVGLSEGIPPRPSNNQWSPADLSPVAIEEQQQEAYAGKYIMPGYSFTVTPSSNGLKVRLPDMRFSLVPVDSHLFFPITKRWLIFPHREKKTLFSFQKVAGVPLMLRHQWQGKTELFGYKMNDGVPVSTAWQRRTGRYEVINRGKGEMVPFTNWKIVKEKSKLYLSVTDIQSRIKYHFLLNTVDDRMAIMLPVGRSSGEVITVLQDNEGGQLLRVFGYILRKK